MVHNHPALKVFGQNIKKHRDGLKLSQEKLAEKSGLDPTYISGIERGVRNPSLLSIIRIADALETDSSNLLEGVGT